MSLLGFVAAFAALTARPAVAQTYVWNTDAVGTWDTATANWLLNGAGAPTTYTSSASVVATFGDVITASRTLGVAAGGVTAGSLNFTNTGTFAYTIGTASNAITLNIGASDATINIGSGFVGTATLIGSGGNTVTGSSLFYTNGLSISNNGAFGTTNLTLAGIIDRAAAGGSITVGGQGNTLISGAITANTTGGLVKNGAGTLVLSSASNAFTGGITVNGGVLSVAADGHLGNTANGITLNAGGTLRFTTATALNAARVITVNGSAANPSQIDLSSSITQVIGAGQLAGSGTLKVLGTVSTGGIFSVEGANPGFTGSLVFGTGNQLVGSVFTLRPVPTSGTGNPTLRLQNAGTLSAATDITFTYGGLVITQPTTAVTGRTGTVPMTFNGGRFAYNTSSNGNVAINETLGNVTASGSFVISGSSAAGPSTGTTLNFGSLTRVNNATVSFRSAASGTGSIGGAPGTGVRYFFSNLTPDTTSSGTTRSVVPWAGHITSATGTDFANLMTYDANGFRPLNTTTEVRNVTASATLGGADAGTNLSVNTSGTTFTTPSGGIALNSIIVTPSSGTVTFTSTAPADVLTITSGATSNFTNLTFNNVVVTTGNSGANPFYFNLGFPNTVSGTSSLQNTGGVVTTSVNSSTSYVLALTNTTASTFTGGLTINGHALVTYTADNQLGASGIGNGITLGGGTLSTGSTLSLAADREIRVGAANGTIAQSAAGGVLTIPGLINGPGS